ncbi:MAG: SUMF1/EgtB/PvdO family nonheme iron enzyme [Candidatus Latescibacterota bacterium]
MKTRPASPCRVPGLAGVGPRGRCLGLALLWPALLLAACTLVNREPANQPPRLEVSRADTLRVRRGGEVPLEVRASDEDDDPLFYQWRAVRLGSTTADTTNAGTFRAADEASTSWIAPLDIEGTAARFLLTVTVRDRQCAVIADAAGRLACEEESLQLVESFEVEVVQTPPQVSVAADTAVPFDLPVVALEARVQDAEDDPVQVFWGSVEGPAGLLLTVEPQGGGRIRLLAVPPLPGTYRLELAASDGGDTVRATTVLRVAVQTTPPAGGEAALTLPGGQGYAIDIYEYPNRRGELPQVVASYFAAARLCADQGKRLCAPEEWSAACSGEEGGTYSSTDDYGLLAGGSFGLRFCNVAGAAPEGTPPEAAAGHAPSGTFPNCSSGNGVYDLTGNLREWVSGVDGAGHVFGGYGESAAGAPPEPCTRIRVLAPLPAGYDPAAAEGTWGLGPEHEAYRTEGLGFRCCR